MAYESVAIGDIVSKCASHAYYAAFACRHTFFNYATASDKATSANGDVTVKNSACGNVTVVFDLSVMFDQCAAVDDAIVTYPGTSVNDSTVHYYAACTNRCVARDMGGGCDDDRQLKPALCGLLIKPKTTLRGLHLPDGDQGVWIRSYEFVKPIISGDDNIAKLSGMPLLRQTDQPSNLILAMLFDNVNTRTRMTTGTDKN
ncbi:MAG: hypothetical protein Q7R66_09850 [Undibacterium sp.]|nr:hypothetical protein [Undibacterium sp.]MDO8652481.1 hypothetical protein [Undibacterium sp.]